MKKISETFVSFFLFFSIYLCPMSVSSSPICYVRKCTQHFIHTANDRKIIIVQSLCPRSKHWANNELSRFFSCAVFLRGTHLQLHYCAAKFQASTKSEFSFLFLIRRVRVGQTVSLATDRQSEKGKEKRNKTDSSQESPKFDFLR